MHLTQKMEQMSVAYITAIAASVGCVVSNWSVDDDSVDCSVTSKTAGRPRIEVQLKATSQVEMIDFDEAVSFSFRLKEKTTMICDCQCKG